MIIIWIGIILVWCIASFFLFTDESFGLYLMDAPNFIQPPLYKRILIFIIAIPVVIISGISMAVAYLIKRRKK